MSGNARKEYKVQNQKKNRDKEMIRKIRQDAVSMSRDRMAREQLLDDDSEEEQEVSLQEEVRDEGGNVSDEEGSPEREGRSCEGMVLDEQGEQVGAEGEKKNSSRMDYYRKLKAAKLVLEKMTMLEKVDVTVKMMVAHDLAEEKLGVRMSPKDVRNHLALGLSKLSSYQVRERSQAILDIVESHVEAERILVTLLQQEVYSDEVAVSLLTAAGLEVEDAFLTRRQQGKKVAMEESIRMTRNRRSGPDRDVGIRLAIAVATRCAFTLEQRGDETVFAECLGSSVKFAKRVLLAVAKGETKSLFKRTRRRDSLVASEWPKVLRAFLDRPVYSRLVPGNDTVSIYYGYRVPKVLLLMTRTKVLHEFKTENPDCPFTIRTLLREIPANYVTMTERDFGRNSCVLHTNFRHQMRHLIKEEILQNTLSSCRYMASLSLCSSNSSFSALDPLTWSEQCVTGVCLKPCPGFAAICPEEKEKVLVSLAQWENKFCEIKQRKIFSLFSSPISLKDLTTMFNKQLDKMTGHLYRAARMWETYKVRVNFSVNNHP